jgi:hypothetical protein
MKFFEKEELKIIAIILLVIGLVSYKNFKDALRRSRDSERKQDISRVAEAVSFYHQDFGFFPPSTQDGRIVACNKEGGPIEIDTQREDISLEEQLLEVFEPCEWGNDGIRDVSDPDYPPYLQTLPKDPQWERGIAYIYKSNTNRFQLYTSLESDEEDEYTENIVEFGVMCGERVCNFGKSFGNTPLDKSIEEYENEIGQKK